MTPPPDTAPAIVWAVYLGANTPTRLAIACGITYPAAEARLRRAWRRGVLTRDADTHRYAPARTVPPRGALARHRAMLRDQRFNPLPHLTKRTA